MFSLLFPLPHLTPLLIPSLLLFAYRTVCATTVCHLGSIRGPPGSELVLKNQTATQHWNYEHCKRMKNFSFWQSADAVKHEV